VLTSMIGARGLGQVVLRGLQRGDVGVGLEAGLAIVLLAVVMDRVTSGYARRWAAGADERGWWRRRSGRTRASPSPPWPSPSRRPGWPSGGLLPASLERPGPVAQQPERVADH